MAGHSKFKNIMHRKGAQDKKRAKLFTKITHEIMTAVRTGSSADPNTNIRLRAAIASAKDINMPKDKVESAIKKASSNDPKEHYNEVRYEGYGPAGSAIMVFGLTDNINRTVGEIRSTFSKYEGHLGEQGSVSYLYKNVGIIEYRSHTVANSDVMLESALEVGATDCEINEDGSFTIICDAEELHNVRELLAAKYGQPKKAYITWISENKITLEEEKQEKILKLIETLENLDDVQEVVVNVNFTISDDE